MKTMQLVAALSFAFAAANALATDAPVKTKDGVLVGAKDMTLYTFEKDAGDGVNNVWPLAKP